MKIIILGMDNTGKTTLANYLHEITDIVKINSEGPKLTKLEMEAVIYANMTNSHSLILERFCFFEELVYGKVLRGKPKFSFKDPIFQYILDAKPLIIYCRPNVEDIKNWRNREQMEGVIDKADELLHQWDKVIKKARKHGLYIFRYDYTKDYNWLRILHEYDRNYLQE